MYKDISEFCNVGINQCKCAEAHDQINHEMAKFAAPFKSTNEIVVDSKSGLVWQREDDNKWRTWQEAKDYCSLLILAGCGGWRLPTRWELESLIVKSESSYINRDAFPSTEWGYWTSTEDGSASGSAQVIDFYDGSSRWDAKSYDYSVRCVR